MLDAHTIVFQPDVCREYLIVIPVLVLALSILDWNTNASTRCSMSDIGYDDNAITARLSSSHVLPGCVVSYVNTCGNASLIPSRRATLLAPSALAFKSISIPPQMASSFIINMPVYLQNYTAGHLGIFILMSIVSPATRPVHGLHTHVPVLAKIPAVGIAAVFATCDDVCLWPTRRLCQEEPQRLCATLVRFVRLTLIRCHNCCRSARCSVIRS